MTMYLGDIPLGSVIPIPFATYAGSTGASATMSGLAVTDIEVYKGTSMTQRASDAGYTLLDTDGIDLDGVTGIQGFSIDTGDNTDAGFFVAGSFYWVVVASVTVDSQTVNFIPAMWRMVAAESTAGTPKADVSMFGGTAGTFSGGRPEVNTTHLAGTAYASADLSATMKSSVNAEADAALADYDAPTKAELDAGLAAIETDTQDIQSRLPAALTADGLMKADTLRVGGTLQTAADLAAMLTIIDDFLDAEIAAILADTGTDIPALIAALNNLSAAQVNAEVVDALATDTYAEPTGVPAATIALATKIGWMYMALRNKLEVTSSAKTFYDDAGNAEWKKGLSDDGVTYSEAEASAP